MKESYVAPRIEMLGTVAEHTLGASCVSKPGSNSDARAGQGGQGELYHGQYQTINGVQVCFPSGP